MAGRGVNGGQLASAASGEKKQSELNAHFAALRDATPIITSCLFCDEFLFHGSAGEARAAALAHRKAKHPEAAVRKPRPTRRVKQSWLRTQGENEQVALDAAEARRVRQEREDADRLEKVLRGRALRGEDAA